MDRRPLIYPGTFDPFHLCHARMVSLAVEWLHPAQITVMPVSHNPFKPGASEATHRVAMANLGLASLNLTVPHVVLSKSYIYPLDLTGFRARPGQLRPWLLAASDVVLEFLSDELLQENLRYFEIAHIARPGVTIRQINAAIAQLPAAIKPRIRIRHLQPQPPLTLNARDIRSTFSQSHLSDRLAPAIHEYARTHQLYSA